MLLFNGSEARVAVTPDKTVYDTLIHNGAEVSNVVTLDCYTYGGNNYRWLFNGVNNVYFMGDTWTGDNYADVNVGTEYNSKLNKGLSYTKTSDAVYLGMNVERLFVMNAAYAFNNCRNLRTFYNSSTPVSVTVILNYITLGKKNCMHLCQNCNNLTGSPLCSDNVVSANSMYYNCENLTGSPICGANVADAGLMYFSCHNLTGSPVCGSNVVTATSMYSGCRNLTGSPVCGDRVFKAGAMYLNCRNLTGSPVCGDNVTLANSMYLNCINLTGSPVCGANVNNTAYMYMNCTNLTGSPVCGANVIDASMMYMNCTNLTGDAYIYSAKLRYMDAMFFNCSNLSNKVHISHLVPKDTSNYIYNSLVNGYASIDVAPENIYNDL